MHPRAPSRCNHIRLDLEFLQKKACRVAAVGLHATHLGGSEHNHLGLVFAETALRREAVQQIELRAAGGGQLVVVGA